MKQMFYNCKALITIYVSQYDSETKKGWTNESATETANMFYGCTSLVGGNGTTYKSSYVNSSYAHIDEADNPVYFTAKIQIISDEGIEEIEENLIYVTQKENELKIEINEENQMDIINNDEDEEIEEIDKNIL
jgi:hypothetical protein